MREWSGILRIDNCYVNKYNDYYSLWEALKPLMSEDAQRTLRGYV